MRTRQKQRVATDTWRSLGCRTTPLEHWSKRKPIVEPRWAKQQTKKAPAPNQNQRTNGPVNAHLTPGPGIYFNAFIHVYSPRAGADNPLGTNVDVNRKPLSLCPFVASFKTISLKYDFKHILNDFIHVYSPRAGTDNPLGTKF